MISIHKPYQRIISNLSSSSITRVNFYCVHVPINLTLNSINVAGLAYFLVWLVVTVGSTLYIPDSIMGLTILAVGSSIEEIFSAIVMTRRGHPEMAIAGSIGSNVFDILMG
ncbi:unnamed protein product, partial [Rotaria magnacalcarata]